MITRYRLSSASIAAVIIVAVLLCFCIISSNNISDIFAFNDSNINTGAIDIGNVLLNGYENRSDGKTFNGNAMTTLYEKLTGKAGAEISHVDALGRTAVRTSCLPLTARSGP